jgi:N-methylhydantoinase B
VEGDGHKFRPWGFAAGRDGFPAELVVRRTGGEEVRLPSKVPYTKARAGDRFIAIGPSGGGYGDPSQRDPERVLRDVLDGFISVGTAARDYGVILTGALEIDREATARARADGSGLSSVPGS